MTERLAFSVDEVARDFGLSKRLVYLACRSGSLPTVPKEIAGDRVLIPAHGLAERVALMCEGRATTDQTETGEQTK